MKDEKLLGTPIALVGHSMGGLVAREAVRVYKDIKVVKLITLASPNYGAKWAAFCPVMDVSGKCTPGIKDMKEYSAFLYTLNKSLGDYTKDWVMTYAITNDEQVPRDSALIPNAKQMIVSSNAAPYGAGSEKHSSIIEKKDVLINIKNFIENVNTPVTLIKGRPKLHGADCTIWSENNSTIRWDLPYNAPADLKIEISDGNKLLAMVNASQKVREGLGLGTLYLRFLSPRYVSETSKVRFSHGALKCSSIVTNNPLIVSSWK